MAKVVFDGVGFLITGMCPKCPEKVTVLFKHGEKYKNAKCIYCGADIHGDAISEIIREGHWKRDDN